MPLFAEEPLALEGGQAVPVYKAGPGSAIDTDYRQILLGSHVIKHHHAFLRSMLPRVAERLIGEVQLGGLEKKGTEHAIVLTQGFISTCRMQRKYALLLFSDLKNAFYSVVRNCLMPAGHGGDVEEVSRSNETPPCLPEPIKMLLSAPAVLDAVGDPHIRRGIQNSLHGTWFEVGGAKDVAL
eukprot:2217641-Pyramimonas_sp.AAC.1